MSFEFRHWCLDYRRLVVASLTVVAVASSSLGAQALSDFDLNALKQRYFSGATTSLGRTLIDEAELVKIFESPRLESETQTEVEKFYRDLVVDGSSGEVMSLQIKASLIRQRAIEILRQLRAAGLAGDFEALMSQQPSTMLLLARVDSEFAASLVKRAAINPSRPPPIEWTAEDFLALRSAFDQMKVDDPQFRLGRLDGASIEAVILKRSDALLAAYDRKRESERSLRVAQMMADQWGLVASTGTFGVMLAGGRLSRTKSYQAIEYGARHPIRTCKIVMNAIGKWLWHPVDEPFAIKPRPDPKAPGRIKRAVARATPYAFVASSGALGLQAVRAYQGETYFPSFSDFSDSQLQGESLDSTRGLQLTALNENMKDIVRAANDDRLTRKLPPLEFVMLEPSADKINPETGWMTYAYGLIKVKEPSLDLSVETLRGLRRQNAMNGILIRFRQETEGQDSELSKRLGVRREAPAAVFWEIDSSVNLQALQGKAQRTIGDVIEFGRSPLNRSLPDITVNPEQAVRLFGYQSPGPLDP